MTYWTFTDDLACDVANEVTALANQEQDQDRKDTAARYLAARVRGLDEKKANAQANANPSPKGQHQPKRGDRFIHRNYLRPDANPAEVREDVENEKFYEERVVTCVRGIRVYHRPADLERGKADSYFPAAMQQDYVRRWL